MNTDLPKASTIDYLHKITSGGLASIPVAGSAAETLFKLLVSEPLQKRRDEWFKELAFVLSELQERFDGFDPRQLANNESFVDVFYSTTQAAMKTHNQARRKALKNAVLNVAAGMTIDDVLHGRFMHLIEEFTGAHIRILTVLADPRNFDNCLKRASRGLKADKPINVIRAEISQEEIPCPVFNIVSDNLADNGLIYNGGLNTSVDDLSIVGRDPLLVKRTTEIGDLFLKFISDPDIGK